jgi:hypothetical protein
MIFAWLLVAFVNGVTSTPIDAHPTTAAAVAKPVPSWPCEERKIVSLSPYAFWSGPEIEEANNWKEADGIPLLVYELVSRKTSMDEAARRIARFAKRNEQERKQRLVLLFSGVFAETNRVYGEVVQGIERNAKRREERWAELVRTQADISDLTSRASFSDQDVSQLNAKMTRAAWLKRVWAQPDQSMKIACEVPHSLEARLYDLAKLIEDQLPANG